MTSAAGSTDGAGEAPLYEVCLQGHLDSRWAGRLQQLAFALKSDGTTTLTGQLPDQAALHGLLAQIRDLGVPILSIRRLEQAEALDMQTNNLRKECHD
jgi:hypothetical protein